MAQAYARRISSRLWRVLTGGVLATEIFRFYSVGLTYLGEETTDYKWLYFRIMLRLTLFGLMGAAAFAQPSVTSVYNAYSYQTTLCPGLVAVVAGANFGTDPTKASVSVGGKPGYVYTASGTYSATSMLVQIPFEATPGQTTLTVTVAGQAASAFNITLVAASPAFSTPSAVETGLALLSDLGPAGTATPFTVSLSAPAQAGDVISGYAIGLGATSPATATGPVGAGTVHQVSPLPKVTVGGIQCTVAFAGVNSGAGPGFYQINFKLPASGVQGTVPLVITVGTASSSSSIDIALPGLSSVVVNGSFANPGTIAPGSIASIFANGLGSASTNQLALFPSSSSEKVQVTFNSEAAPMFHLIPTASPQQIDLLIPSDLPTSGTVNVQLTTSSANYPNYTLNMVPASPSMFRFTDPKTSNAYAIVQFSNSAWVVLPTAAATNIGFPVCAASTDALTECGQPANIGDYIVIYLTGLGLATPNGDPKGTPLPSGQNPPVSGNPLYETPTLPTVTIGGVPTIPAYSGLSPGFAGEYQVVVQVPPGVASGDSVPVVITMMGQSDTANISIQPSRIKPPNQ